MTSTGATATGGATLGFGQVFTEHMVTMTWTTDQGWNQPRLTEFADLALSPAAMVLHYGQAIFEGLKAYRGPTGQILLFRPDQNARRFAASARRMAMPELSEEDFLDCVELLVRTESGSVPAESGHSLYLRPFMIATEATLGTRPARRYEFLVIGSPSGPYFVGGFSQGITVWVATDHPRAHPGGTGAAKCAGNYAGGMVVQQEAESRGCDQVVFLDAREGRYLEELGGMNVVLVRRDGSRTELVTPPLSDTILEGVTRLSILTLARELGATVTERLVSLDDWRSGSLDGTVSEAFACGTAAVVTPIGRVRTDTDEFTVGDGRPGPVSTQLREELLAIQEGRRSDSHGWTRSVC